MEDNLFVRRSITRSDCFHLKAHETQNGIDISMSQSNIRDKLGSTINVCGDFQRIHRAQKCESNSAGGAKRWKYDI